MKSVTRWWVNRQIDTLFLTPEIGEKLAVDGACGCLNGCWRAARMVTARANWWEVLRLKALPAGVGTS